MSKKIVVITGGSSGLGFELAKLISAEYSVCIVARNIQNLEYAAKKLSSKNDHLTYQADVSKEEQVHGLFKYLREYEIKYIINCAGAGLFGNPEDINTQMVDYLIDCNLKSVIYMSANGLKALKDNGGTIATVLSTAALKGNAQESIYCAVKWGAKGYCEALKTAYKGTNIKIMTLCPGGINTPFWKDNCGLSPDLSKFMDPQELAITMWSLIKEKNTLFCPEIVIEKL